MAGSAGGDVSNAGRRQSFAEALDEMRRGSVNMDGADPFVLTLRFALRRPEMVRFRLAMASSMSVMLPEGSP